MLGDPIEHSLSPLLHATAYAELGLDWEYRKHRIGEGELDSFLTTAPPGLRGLSLTMPLKRRAYQIGAAGGGLGAAAEQVRVANTLVPTRDGLRAENTDVGGLVAALPAADGGWRPRHALILGAGATAAALLAAAGRLGVRTVTIAARTPKRAQGLSGLAERCGIRLTVVPLAGPGDLGGSVPGATDLVASVLPGGAADPYAEVAARLAPVLFDAAYEPWPTRLTSAGRAVGARVVDGLDLLVAQAVLQVNLMTGLDVPGRIADAMAAVARARVRPATETATDTADG